MVMTWYCSGLFLKKSWIAFSAWTGNTYSLIFISYSLKETWFFTCLTLISYIHVYFRTICLFFCQIIQQVLRSQFVQTIVIHLHTRAMIVLKLNDPLRHRSPPESILWLLSIYHFSIKLIVLLKCKWKGLFYLYYIISVNAIPRDNFNKLVKRIFQWLDICVDRSKPDVS